MRSLLLSLKNKKAEQDYVLAIVTQTEGSTYRKTGAMMLIDREQRYWGLLSGGCLENDLTLRAQEVFANKQDSQVIYNMKEQADLLWGMGLGCDGEITILLKLLPANENHFEFFTTLQRLQDGQNYQMGITEDNQLQFKSIGETSLSKSPHQWKFIIELKSPHHLLICGGSPDVQPVTAIAHQMGWKTTVIDHRKAYADDKKFPFASHVEQVKRSMWNTFELSSFDSVVVMSHQFEMDILYLKRLITSSIPYIGLLGPIKRRDNLLQECGTHFKNLEKRLYAPIGLDLGSESPEAIALSIISEIQAVKNAKSAVFSYQDPTR